MKADCVALCSGLKVPSCCVQGNHIGEENVDFIGVLRVPSVDMTNIDNVDNVIKSL